MFWKEIHECISKPIWMWYLPREFKIHIKTHFCKTLLLWSQLLLDIWRLQSHTGMITFQIVHSSRISMAIMRQAVTWKSQYQLFLNAATYLGPKEAASISISPLRPPQLCSHTEKVTYHIACRFRTVEMTLHCLLHCVSLVHTVHSLSVFPSLLYIPVLVFCNKFSNIVTQMHFSVQFIHCC